MAGSTIWKGNIHFGDVNVPVKLHTAIKEDRIQFHLLHRRDKFEDEHQKKLQNLIDKKARGEKIAVLRPRLLKPTTSDKLLQALEASLKKVA